LTPPFHFDQGNKFAGIFKTDETPKWVMVLVVLVLYGVPLAGLVLSKLMP
jgi:hypothetical protein